MALRATLTATEAREVWSAMLAADPALGNVFRKGDLDAAVLAADAWLAASAPSLDATLPKLFRSSATDEQKARLWAYVTMKRAGMT